MTSHSNPRVNQHPIVVGVFWTLYIQGGPEKILLRTIVSFVVNSNFCEPPCIIFNKRMDEVCRTFTWTSYTACYSWQYSHGLLRVDIDVLFLLNWFEKSSPFSAYTPPCIKWKTDRNWLSRNGGIIQLFTHIARSPVYPTGNYITSPHI